MLPSTSRSTTTRTGDQRASIGRSLLAAAVAVFVLVLVVLMPGAGAEPVPELPPGVTISVNGQSMTGDEGGKIDGCTLSIAVDGLDPQQSPTNVGVKVNAVAPTTPEGSPATLVDHSTSVEATSWSEDLVMDDLVAPFPIKANGYHLRVLVSLDGTLAATGVYWLACGAEQSGNPTRILFAVEWVTNEGITTDIAPDQRLPAAWRDSLRVAGSSHNGEATCDFLPDASQLACVYDNPGHGDHPGLVVPGNPQATYDVSATGIPAGWTLDASTVGTFVGRETCPRGEDEVVVTAEHEGPFTCTHVVRLAEDPVPPTTTTAVPSTTAAPVPTTAAATTPTTAAPSGVQAAGVQQTPVTGTLPATGSSDSTLLAVGSLLVLTGAAVAGYATRARRGTDRC
jgi:LPXTG-motif cell wall-anchored protein